MHVEAMIELADGRTLTARCDGPRGVWGKPPIPEAEHLVKVRDCFSGRLPPAAVERCIALAATLDDQPADGVRELLMLIGNGS
jgi:hypothetical protein